MSQEKREFIDRAFIALVVAGHDPEEAWERAEELHTFTADCRRRKKVHVRVTAQDAQLLVLEALEHAPITQPPTGVRIRDVVQQRIREKRVSSLGSQKLTQALSALHMDRLVYMNTKKRTLEITNAGRERLSASRGAQ